MASRARWGAPCSSSAADFFEASSAEVVDRCWDWVLTQGVATESAPKEFPHYVEGYYATFFYDPDGIKLEVVHEPTRAVTTSP